MFIGKSSPNEMTRFSDGYGPDFDGNTILVENRECEYVSTIYHACSMVKLNSVNIGSEIFLLKRKTKS